MHAHLGKVLVIDLTSLKSTSFLPNEFVYCVGNVFWVIVLLQVPPNYF